MTPPVYNQPVQAQQIPLQQMPQQMYQPRQEPVGFTAPVMNQQNVSGFAPTVQGNLILEAGQFTRYMGDKAIGVVTGQGFVDVYDDRIEFRKTSGEQWGYAANPIVGVLVAKHDKKKHPMDTYYFRDLKSIKAGKYSGMIPTFILEFKSGKPISFAKTAKSRTPAEVIEIVKRYVY
jgi:hypothetical protein